eukprot:1289962-Rhodomonas_salina.1
MGKKDGGEGGVEKKTEEKKGAEKSAEGGKTAERTGEAEGGGKPGGDANFVTYNGGEGKGYSEARWKTAFPQALFAYKAMLSLSLSLSHSFLLAHLLEKRSRAFPRCVCGRVRACVLALCAVSDSFRGFRRVCVATDGRRPVSYTHLRAHETEADL